MSSGSGLYNHFNRSKLFKLAILVFGVGIIVSFTVFASYLINPTAPKIGPLQLPPLYSYQQSPKTSSVPTPTPLPTLSPTEATKLVEELDTQLNFPGLPSEALDEIRQGLDH